MRKKILVVGGGGREHSICWALNNSKSKPEIFCAPGNAGIAQIAHCVKISSTDINGLINFSIENKIDFAIVGGEVSLAAGIVDEFEKHNLAIIGPSLAASRLESSKSFAKDFMIRHGIPTAHYRAITHLDEAINVLESGEFGERNSPIVVKADGLAAGKGVIITKNHAEAIAATQELLEAKNKSIINNKVLLEETLIGREVSLLLFSDGKDYALMPPARDYKRVNDGDKGANTGGMGTFTNNDLLSDTEQQEITSKIIEPTLRAASNEGFPFRGILFLGLMLTPTGIKLLEYNVRFGDPEAQSILVRLESDFVEICESINKQNLGNLKIKFSEESSVCVILATKGYPANPMTGDVISGLENISNNIFIFHSGTEKNEKNQIVTSGGRVLGITAKNMNLKIALETVYEFAKKISWKDMQYRSDIGK